MEAPVGIEPTIRTNENSCLTSLAMVPKNIIPHYPVGEKGSK